MGRSTSNSTSIPEQDLEGAIEEFAYYSDEPSADAGALPVWFLSKMCKARTTVALSGEGADELFGGYLTYRANDFAQLLRRFPRPALQLALTCVAAVARIRREDRPGIQAEAPAGRLVDGTGESARLLERHVLRGRQREPDGG